MAAHDSQASQQYVSGQTFTWNHTIASGGKILVWVAFKFNALSSVTGVTVGGSPAELVSSVQNGSGGARLEMWKHESPGTGSQAVEITFNNDISGDGGKACGASASTTSLSGYASGTTSGPTVNTTPTITIPSLGANDMPYAGALTGGDPTEADTLVVENFGDSGLFLNVSRQSIGGDGVINWTEGGGDEWMVAGTRAIDGSSGPLPKSFRLSNNIRPNAFAPGFGR